MSARENGGPAFPTPGQFGNASSDGMTLRDYLAAQALVGLLNRAWDDYKLAPDDLYDAWASAAYRTADAMLKARAA